MGACICTKKPDSWHKGRRKQRLKRRGPCSLGKERPQVRLKKHPNIGKNLQPYHLQTSKKSTSALRMRSNTSERCRKRKLLVVLAAFQLAIWLKSTSMKKPKLKRCLIGWSTKST